MTMRAIRNLGDVFSVEKSTGKSTIASGILLMKWALLALVVPILVSGFAGVASAQIIIRQPVLVGYTLTDLSTNAAPNDWSDAYAINNAGRVTGEFYNTLHQDHAFETQANAQIQNTDELGVLVINGTADVVSAGYAINGSGAVVGNSCGSSGPTICTSHAFLFVPGSGLGLENLNTVSGSNTRVLTNAIQTFGRGINDAGWIVGYFTTASDKTTDFYQTHSFVSFGPGWTQPIDSMYGNPAFSATYDVNNKDQFAGFLRRQATDNPVAFLFDTSSSRLTTIGTLPGGGSSLGYALNDSGQVVGSSQVPNGWGGMTTHAFLFQDLNQNGIVDAGELKDLDTVNSGASAAFSINNGGTAVGYFGGAPEFNGTSRAAVFVNGKVTDLNTMVQGGTGGAILRVGYGINDSGQIVGYMQTPAGAVHGFRLNPVFVLR